MDYLCENNFWECVILSGWFQQIYPGRRTCFISYLLLCNITRIIFFLMVRKKWSYTVYRRSNVSLKNVRGYVGRTFRHRVENIFNLFSVAVTWMLSSLWWPIHNYYQDKHILHLLNTEDFNLCSHYYIYGCDMTLDIRRSQSHRVDSWGNYRNTLSLFGMLP